MKTGDGFEWTEVKPGYWRDDTTGLIWSPKLDGEFCFENAQILAPGKDAPPDLKWSIPTRKEWMMAEIHDIREVLPEMNYCFWSSSPSPSCSDDAYGFNGDYGDVGVSFRYSTYSVRCCARSK